MMLILSFNTALSIQSISCGNFYLCSKTFVCYLGIMKDILVTTKYLFEQSLIFSDVCY